jgi:hypothetical protein
MEPFKHQPIPTESDDIRLIRFINEETIEIIHTPLEKAPEYRALSYAWGDKRDRCTDPIRVAITEPRESSGESSASVSASSGSTSTIRRRKKHRSMDVTLNCQLALRRIFEDDSTTAVWIDAICIDQSNKLELNHQVKRMSRIYSMARKVQIFLGPDTEMSELGFAYIKRERKHIDSGHSPLLHNSYEHFANSKEKKGLEEILSREWFSRRWVLQEVHYARVAEVICGSHTLPWEYLRLLGYHKYKQDSQEMESHGSVDSERLLPPVLQLQEGETINKDLLYWIEETAGLNSQRELDKVYSLLGLASDTISNELELMADYRRDFEDVMVQLFKHYGTRICRDICQQHFIDISTPQSLDEAFESMLTEAYNSGIVLVAIPPVRWLLLSSWLGTTEWLRDTRLGQVFPQETRALSVSRKVLDLPPLSDHEKGKVSASRPKVVPHRLEPRSTEHQVTFQAIRDLRVTIEQHVALNRNITIKRLDQSADDHAINQQMREADAMLLTIRNSLDLWNNITLWESHDMFNAYQKIHSQVFDTQLWEEKVGPKVGSDNEIATTGLGSLKKLRVDDRSSYNENSRSTIDAWIPETSVSDDHLAHEMVLGEPVSSDRSSLGDVQCE